MIPAVFIVKTGATETTLSTHFEDSNNKKINVTGQIKQVIKEIIKEKGLKIEQVVDLDVCFEEEHINNDSVFIELVQSNLIKEQKDNKCLFFKNNKMWVSQDQDTLKYRYFSTNNKEYFYLDIIDLFILFSEKNFGEAITDMIKSFGFETEEEIWKEQQRQKYLNNIAVIENAAKLKNKYKNLYKLSKSCLNILLKLNVIAMQHVISKEKSVNNQAVFFSSIRYISKFVNESISTVTNKVNFLTLLKIIEKVETKKIPKDLLLTSLKNKNRNIINYYVLYELTDDFLEEAEKRAEYINSKSFTYRKMSLLNVKKSFDKETVNMIYKNNLENTKKQYKRKEERGEELKNE